MNASLRNCQPWHHRALLGALLAVCSAVLLVTAQEGLGQGAGGCERSPQAGSDLNGFVESLLRPRFLFASTGDEKLFASTDGGTAWNVVAAHIPGRVVAAYGKKVVFAAGEEGLYRTLNTGLSWDALLCGVFVSTVTLANDGRTLYVGTEANIATGEGGGLYRSTDSGSTWTSLRLPTRNANVYVVALPSKSQREVFVATEAGGILKSTDAGGAFRWLTVGKKGLPGAHGNQVTSIAFQPGSESVLWVGTRLNGVWRTDNAGLRWKEAGLPNSYISGIAVGADGLDVSRLGKVSPTRNSSRPDVLSSADGEGWHVIERLGGQWNLTPDLQDGSVFAWRGRDLIRIGKASEWSEVRHF